MNINIFTEEDSFSVDEIKKLLQCVREIEQNNPKRHISIFVDSPERTVEEMKSIISSINPGFPHTEILDFKKD